MNSFQLDWKVVLKPVFDLFPKSKQDKVPVEKKSYFYVVTLQLQFRSLPM